VHKKCSDINGSLFKASKSFVCRSYSDQPATTARTSVDIVTGASLKLVDKFCYMGDMLSINGYADATAETRVQKE